jgi:hypothetical protein
MLSGFGQSLVAAVDRMHDLTSTDEVLGKHRDLWERGG